jgi:hypothetical protein
MLVERPKLDGEGAEYTLVVGRFLAVWPGQGCERSGAQAHPPGGPKAPE